MLSRETFHRFNRFGLLSLLALSCTIPMILSVFPLQQLATVFVEPASKIEVDALSMSVLVDDAKSETGNAFLSFLLIIYITGCFFYLFYVILSTLRIRLIIKKGSCSTIGNGTKLVLLDETNITPFSWMNYIVLSRFDHQTAGESIITHESAHIRLCHSLDLIIAQFCIITQWFNPAAWLLYRELQNIHEYEADDEVIRSGINAKQYQLLLIKKAVGTRLYSMANSLNHSNLKKRIAMMLQKKSNPWARLKYTYVLPLAAFTVALFAQPEISMSFDEISTAKVNHFALEISKNEKNAGHALNMMSVENEPLVQVRDDSIYQLVEKEPEFPGGIKALLTWIKDNLMYPETAAQNGNQRRVYCQFVVEKDGSVSNVKVLRGVTPELDAEAVRVLKSLPKFKPGMHKGQPVRVLYKTPILFRLDGASPETKEKETTVQEPDENFIHQIVEKDPEFPGGVEALLKWIKDHLKFPETAIQNGKQGRIYCQFVIEKDGSVSNVEVTRGISPDLDAEAIRVLSTLPKFKPGTHEGQTVRVKYLVPVRFDLPRPNP